MLRTFNSSLLSSVLFALGLFQALHQRVGCQTENVLGKNFTFFMRYPLSGGLANQHYSQLIGIWIGLELQASTIIMPAPYYRRQYREDASKQTWTPFDHHKLYDVKLITLFCESRGVKLQLGPKLPLEKLLNNPELPPNTKSFQVLRLPEIHAKFRTMTEVLTEISDALAEYIRSNLDALRKASQANLPIYLTYGLPPLLGVQLTDEPLAGNVFFNLNYAHALMQIAYKAADRMLLQLPPHSKFNGIHLRVEVDAQGWFGWLGDGVKGFWRAHVAAADELGFKKKALFVATAAGTVWAPEETEMTKMGWEFVKRYSTQYFTRDMLLSKRDRKLLTSEQGAAVDLLILTRAEGFIGCGFSTFARLVHEYRLMAGKTPESTIILGKEKLSSGVFFGMEVFGSHVS